MVLSQNPPPVVRNPYAKPPAKRQRQNESISLGTEGIPTIARNEVGNGTVSVAYGRRCEASIQNGSLKSDSPAVQGAHVSTMSNNQHRLAQMSNPYRKSPERPTLPIQQAHDYTLPMKQRENQEMPPSPCQESSTNQTDLFDTGFNWEAAAAELNYACSQTTSFSANGSGDQNDVYRKSTSTNELTSCHSDNVAARRESTAHAPPTSVSRTASGPSLHVSGQSQDSRQVASSTAAALGHGIRPSSWLRSGQPAVPDSQVSTTSSLDRSNYSAGSKTGSNAAASSVGSGKPQLPHQLNYSPASVLPVADEYRGLLIKNADLSTPLLNGWTLFQHQKRAILKGLVMRRVILALDMGLGKTCIGCVWSKAFYKTFPDLRIYVICPVSLKKEWKRTAVEAVGLEATEDEMKDGESGMQVCSWSKVPSIKSTKDFKFIIVCDEAHSMQSMQSARTKNALQLASSRRCLGVLLLTGTPMKNGKPLNLFPLLKAVRHPFGYNQKAYEIHFCEGREKSFGRGRSIWDANGASNLPLLRAHISSHLLHMTKEDCLKDLPPQTRVFHKIPVSSRYQLRHDDALKDLARLYQNSQNFENSCDVILTAVQRVRKIGSESKIDSTVALAKSVLEEEPAVVIFTSFVGVAQSVHKRLGELGWSGELLTGETAQNKRQAMVDNFQAGMSSVFVCTFGAGGVGLTLTAAHTVILLDRPWTPGDASQAEDRVRRIGQTKPVKSIWVVAFDLDEQIDSVLEQKSQNASTVLTQGGGDDSGPVVDSAPKISIFRLLKSVLPRF